MVGTAGLIAGAVTFAAIVVLGLCFILPTKWRPVLLMPLAFYLAWQFIAWPMTGSERDEVRAAGVALLAADTAVGQWPADMKGREHSFKTGADARRAALAKVWVPWLVGQHVKEWEAGLAEFYDDPSYEPYDNNRFVVTDWRSTRQKIDRVQVVFRGHHEYRDSKTGEWSRSADGTEELTLRRIDGRWLIAHESVSDYNPS
jgi:hypothetical protein